MRVQVDRQKRLNSQDLFHFQHQKCKKSLELYLASWTNRTEIIGPLPLKLFKSKQEPNNLGQSK